MIEPKKVLRILLNRWDIIAQLFDQIADSSITLQELHHLVVSLIPQSEQSDVSNIIDSLQNVDILVPVANNPNRFEINVVIMEFVGYLKNEHRLGLSEEIEAYLKHLELLANKIAQAVQAGESIELVKSARELDLRMREVIKKLQHDEKALEGIAEQAKMANKQIPLRQRYAEVISSWDEYLEPMVEMIDLKGVFDRTVRVVENQLQNIIHKMDVVGVLIDELEIVRQAQARMMAMEKVAQHTLKRGTEILLPLREEVRINNSITQGASLALAIIRKQGINDLKVETRVPLLAQSHKNVVSSSAGIEKYIYGLHHFEPTLNRFPARHSDRKSPDKVITFNQVKRQVIKSLPIADIMTWLIENYAMVSTDNIIEWFAMLTRGDRFQKQRLTRRDYLTKTHRISLRSYQILQKIYANPNR